MKQRFANREKTRLNFSLTLLLIAVVWLGVVPSLTGHAAAGADLRSAVGHGSADSSQARVEVGRHAIAFSFAERNNLPHGVAADALHVFVTEPLNGRVAVINRITGVRSQRSRRRPAAFCCRLDCA